MSPELDILNLTCSKLNQANIPYMLTGSFAANFYAVPRMTRDIDIVVAILPYHVKKLLELFKDDFYVDRDAINDAIQHSSMFNMIHQESVLKIDFIIRKDTPYRQLEFDRRHHVLFSGIPVWIVSPEDLIISKLFWAKDSLSKMQLNDIRNLISSIKTLDYEYIKKWVSLLELIPIYERLNTDE